MYTMLRDRGAVVVREQPTFASPTSQLVSAAQFYEPRFAEIAARLKLDSVLDRKN